MPALTFRIFHEVSGKTKDNILLWGITMLKRANERQRYKSYKARPLSESEDLLLSIRERQYKAAFRKRLVHLIMGWISLVGTFIPLVTNTMPWIEYPFFASCFIAIFSSFRSNDRISAINGCVVLVICMARIIYGLWFL